MRESLLPIANLIIGIRPFPLVLQRVKSDKPNADRGRGGDCLKNLAGQVGDDEPRDVRSRWRLRKQGARGELRVCGRRGGRWLAVDHVGGGSQNASGAVTRTCG